MTIVAKRGELPHEGAALGRIHADANRRKATAYWLGFLRGVLASSSIETLEFGPLRAEAGRFLENFQDEGAEELIEDLGAGGEGGQEAIFRIVERAEAERSRDFRMRDRKDATNELYGFCAGIACDNHITPSEVETLLARIAAAPEALEDRRVRSLEWAARRSIVDGRITDEEAGDICGWISRLVGDSCTDTGLATYGNVGVVDGALRDPEGVVFPERMFVLTGKFSIGPRKVVAALVTERGGAWKNTVCKQTDYLVVAASGSRDWVHSSEGTKILKAMEIRRNGGRLHVVEEPTFASALGHAP